MAVRVGTAAWADRALIETDDFYPPEVNTPAARMRYYATQFPLVEVNSSFYAVPGPDRARRWAERTPDGFTINMKAFRLLTGHQTAPDALPADVRGALPNALRGKPVLYYGQLPAELVDEVWRSFAETLQPLKLSGRLGLVHFQFPPWLVRNKSGLAHVAHCTERLAEHTLSIEFRNASWFEGTNAEDTISFMRDLGAVHTVVDEPQGFTNSVPPLWVTSHDRFALVRMHGRNAASWNNSTGGSGGRFNYDYDNAELEGLARQIERLSAQSAEVHVVLNNNRDQAQRNGRTLLGVLREVDATVVEPIS